MPCARHHRSVANRARCRNRSACNRSSGSRGVRVARRRATPPCRREQCRRHAGHRMPGSRDAYNSEHPVRSAAGRQRHPRSSLRAMGVRRCKRIVLHRHSGAAIRRRVTGRRRAMRHLRRHRGPGRRIRACRFTGRPQGIWTTGGRRRHARRRLIGPNRPTLGNRRIGHSRPTVLNRPTPRSRRIGHSRLTVPNRPTPRHRRIDRSRPTVLRLRLRRAPRPRVPQRGRPNITAVAACATTDAHRSPVIDPAVERCERPDQQSSPWMGCSANSRTGCATARIPDQQGVGDGAGDQRALINRAASRRQKPARGGGVAW